MSRIKPLMIDITTQNGTPPSAANRAQRHKLWLDFCNKLEEELGPCTPSNVLAYQVGLEDFDKQLNLPLTITRRWPTSKAAFKKLTQELGTQVIALELTALGSLIAVAYVTDSEVN